MAPISVISGREAPGCWATAGVAEPSMPAHATIAPRRTSLRTAAAYYRRRGSPSSIDFQNGLLALRPMKLMLTMSGILLYCAVIQAAPGATDDQDGSAPLTPKTLATALAAQP